MKSIISAKDLSDTARLTENTVIGSKVDEALAVVEAALIKQASTVGGNSLSIHISSSSLLYSSEVRRRVMYVLEEKGYTCTVETGEDDGPNRPGHTHLIIKW